MSHDVSHPRRDARRIGSYVAGWLGMAAMLALAPFYLAAGLMAPLWAVIALIAIWLVLFALGVLVIAKRRPLIALLVPVIAAGVWWLVMSLGERLLGWTA